MLEPREERRSAGCFNIDLNSESEDELASTLNDEHECFRIPGWERWTSSVDE